MYRFKRASGLLALAGAVAAAACSDPLDVDNRNNPDRGSVLNLPRDVEALSSNLYQNLHAAQFNSTTAVYPQLLVVSFENASSLNNFAMGPRSGIPRPFLDNSPGNSFILENYREFQRGENSARTAATIFEKINDPAFTLGNAADDARLRAFTWFGYGINLGLVAMVYDSAAIPRPGDATNTPPLVGYDSVMRAALNALDSAQAIASRTGSAAMSAVPSAWLAQSANVTPANFVRIVRAHKARYRANVARTLDERSKVNWAAVIADATNGLTADFTLQLNPNTGYDYAWLASHYTTGSANWHQMPPYIIGMADTSGAYDQWLGTARNNRSAFLIRTPDRRFPAGESRAVQNANSPLTGSPATLYFRNRAAGEDQPGAPWGVSQYDFNRWRALFLATRVGSWPTFTKVENDMLAAEGYIRTGQIASAVPLINTSRVRNGLAAIPTTAALGAPVPGAGSCVPRVPDPTRGNAATRCGDVYEAMKYEKRMETAYAGYAVWYFDMRGWNDLPEGTPVNWPTPTQERDARLLPSYGLGGRGNPGAAGVSTYGFGSGDL